MSYESAPGMSEEGHQSQAPAASKPPSVSMAERLMYGGAAVTVLGGVLSLFGDQDEMREQMREQLEASGQGTDEASIEAAMQMGVVVGVVTMVIGAALWVLMGWLNGRGVGWARIVATVLGVLGVLLTVAGLAGSALLPGAAAGGAVAMVISIITGLIALAVVVLLWRPDASAFFAARKRR